MQENVSFPTHVVGIGTSAGGLESLELFFSNVTHQTGITYVVIQHLSPDFKSMMSEILGRVTKLPIYQIEDGNTLHADTIYLNIPRYDVTYSAGQLFLHASQKKAPSPRPIDHFFTSLGRELKDRSVGVILSGSGQDGANGLLEIQQKGGLALVQDLESALFSSMPKSAAVLLDKPILVNPSEMANIIINHALDPNTVVYHPAEELPIHSDDQALAYLMTMMRRRFEIDFTRYKPYTLFRRLDGRIEMLGLQSLAEYVLHLQSDQTEQDALYRDLLIDVTAFFRDPEAFSFLEKEVLPGLVEQKADGESIRVWVAACATGEEAYSLGMLLFEEIEKQGRNLDCKIFATDAHQSSINTASDGLYRLEQVREQMSEALVKKYFKEIDEETLQVDGHLRSSIVFSPHNLLENPHFSRLDLVSCRNFLIYIENDAQNELLSRFHLGLKLGGILFLGSSEHLRETAPDYDVLSNQWRIYRKTANTSRVIRYDPEQMVKRIPKYIQQRVQLTSSNQWEGRLIQELVEMGYVVDNQGNLKEVYGDGQKFLKFKTGRITLLLTNMLPESLAIPIRTGLQLAQREGDRVRYNRIVYREGASAEEIVMAIEIVPFQGAGLNVKGTGSFYLVTLEQLEEPTQTLEVLAEAFEPEIHESEVKEGLTRVLSLERELMFTRESLQATIEEMQSTNEELQSANEELQSTNEELSSVNEELFTVNSEYLEQNHTYTRLNNDMRNMLAVSQVVMVLLDTQFKLRSFTPNAQRVFSFIESDLGRPIFQFNLFASLDSNIFKAFCQRALEGETLTEVLLNSENLPMTLQLSPYLTKEHGVDGVIIYVETGPNLEKFGGEYIQAQNDSGAFPSLPQLILVHDLEQKSVVFSGGMLLQHLGYKDPIEGDDAASLLHAEADLAPIDLTKEEAFKLRREGKLIHDTYLLKKADGDYVEVNVNESAYNKNSAGELIQTIMIITPIQDPTTLTGTVQG